MDQKTILVIGNAQRRHYQFLRDEIIRGTSPREVIENAYLEGTKEMNSQIAAEEGILHTPDNMHLFNGCMTEPVIVRITADMFLFDDFTRDPDLPESDQPKLGHQDMFSEGIDQANRLTESMGNVHAIVIDLDVLHIYMTKSRDCCFGAHVLHNLYDIRDSVMLFVRDDDKLNPIDLEDIAWEW